MNMFEKMRLERKLNFSFGAAVLAFCFALASCANMFQDKVSAPNGDAVSTLGEMFVSAEEIGKLDTPSEIHVSLYEFKDKIRVSWSPVKHAAYYTLERAVASERNENGDWVAPKDEEFEVLEHTQQIYGTSYTDTIIKDDPNDPLEYSNEKYGCVYFYRVHANNPRLGYEAGDAQISSYGALLPPPSNTKASAGESTDFIEISWNKSHGAIRYEIYRSEREDSSNSTKVGTVTADTSYFKDNKVSSFGGNDLFYTVLSIGTTGEKSVVGPVALGYTLLPGAPGRVNEVHVTTGHGDYNNMIEIEWEPLKVAENEIITYTVYRSSSESSTMVNLKTQSSPFKDSSNLKPNVYYYYYVQASKVEEDNDSKPTTLKGPMSKSGPDDTKPAEGFILSAPSTVEVQKIVGDSNNCRIDFTPVIGDKNFPNNSGKYENPYRYVVYGGTNIGVKFSEEAGTDSNPIFANGKYSMTVKSYPYYQVAVRNKEEVESTPTEVYAPAPYAAKDVYVTRAALVGDGSQYVPTTQNSPKNTEPGSNANGVHKVKITWKAPDGGASSYHVYRSEKQDSGFKKITATAITATEYIDDNVAAKPGIIYYYQVLSLNSLGQGANRSEIDTPTLEGGVLKTKNADGSPYGRGWGYGALSAWHFIHEMCKTVDYSHEKSEKLTSSSLTGKIGTEIINGDVTGILDYNAKMDGIGGRAILEYKNYVDYYVNGDSALGYYFMLNGNTNSSANASQNGTMDGTVTCNGMYLGSVKYDKVEVKSGDSGGGYYMLKRTGIDDQDLNVNYLAGKK